MEASTTASMEGSSEFHRRLSSATSSSSATSADGGFSDNDDAVRGSGHHRKSSLVPMKNHGGSIAPTVYEHLLHCPTIEEVNHQIELFERKRLEFNKIQLLNGSTSENTTEWDRKKSLEALAARLKKMAVTMAESLAFRTAPPTTTSSWLGTETDVQNYELCYQANGLSVWKKDFGNDRVIVRGEFVIPVSPKQYCQYASNIERRREWDTNVAEARKIEEVDEGIDIAYVSINRIATIYPRDYINIRVIKELRSFGRPQRKQNHHQRQQHFNPIKLKSGGKQQDDHPPPPPPPQAAAAAPQEPSHEKRSSMSIVSSKGDDAEQSRESPETKIEDQRNGVKRMDEHDGVQQNNDDVKTFLSSSLSIAKVESEGQTTTTTKVSSSNEFGLQHRNHESSSSFKDSHHQRSSSQSSSTPPSQIHIGRHGCYMSASCSIVHPDIPEVPSVVRADVKMACYLAQPLYLPNRQANLPRRASGSSSEVGAAIKEAVAEAEPQKTTTTDAHPQLDPIYHHDPATTIWSRVYMFSEVDPKGWLPSTMSKHLAARVLPGTVERIVGCMLDHYGYPWRTELVYDPIDYGWKRCDSALEYCYLRFKYSVSSPTNGDEGFDDDTITG